MEVEKTREEIIIRLTQEEVFDLQAGRTIHGGRPAITMSFIDPNDSITEAKRFAIDRLEKAAKTPLRSHLFSDGDLQVFVPIIKLTDVRIANARLPREAIETPGTKDRKGPVGHVISLGGIRLVFGGSLKRVNVPDFFS